MTRKPERRGLGRGLSALLGEIQSGGDAAGQARPVGTLPIDLIRANPAQPRRDFPEAELDELARSIRTHGVIQPIIVRSDPANEGAYQIVAGERRWRAAQKAGLDVLPVVVRDSDDREMMELALIENIQRVDLNPIEEAAGFVQLIEKFSYTQEQLAQTVGKSRSHVANAMRLLNLPAGVRDMVRSGQLTAGHARALLAASDPLALARATVAEGLSVRQVEARAKAAPSRPGRPPRADPAPEKDADTRMLEGDLSAAIGMRVSITHRDGAEGGEMRISYRSLDELDRLCQKLSE